MVTDRRSTVLYQIVTELTGLEQHISRLFADHKDAGLASPETAALRSEISDLARSHIEALDAYLGDSELRDRGVPRRESVGYLEGLLAVEGTPDSVSAGLQTDLMVLSLISGRYAALCEMAFRLYEPDLREIGPRHFGDYARAMRAVIQLIPPLTAMELADAGLGCHCVCPMCTIGACGCVAVAASIVGDEWTGDAAEPESQGFSLLAPRAGSQLAEAGIQGGDRLVAVDGVAVNSFQEVQDAIRKHQLGEEVRFSISRNGGSPREVNVRHVHDY